MGRILVVLEGFRAKLRRHPFPVVAWFEQVRALTFAFPKEVLEPLLARPLKLDGYEDFGFVTVALVETRNLRPAGVPEIFGQDFFLAGYRIFATLRDEEGRRLRGLRILRSETDRARMVWSGNLLTHYQYRRIRLETGERRVRTFLPDGRRTLDLVFGEEEPSELPEGSPFPDWRTARRFAGPMPFTFDAEEKGRFVIIEGKRSDWVPRPLAVKSWEVSLFEEEAFLGCEPILANAFEDSGVPYGWERGRICERKGDDE